MITEKGTSLDGWGVKKHLAGLANKTLPSTMGARYTKIVVNCLTCLDEDNLDFGNLTRLKGDDGIKAGVLRFKEKVRVPAGDRAPRPGLTATDTL